MLCRHTKSAECVGQLFILVQLRVEEADAAAHSNMSEQS